MKTVRIKKWGNSLALRIPKHMADEMELGEDSLVEIKRERGNLVLVPLRKEYSLDDLIAQITPDNTHSEIGPDNLLGNEAW